MLIPTRLLYLGASGEHYVMAECYRSNMEAFKLPVDRGFDLAVTKAYIHFKAAEDYSEQPEAKPTFYLQVKSSSAKLSSDTLTEKDRPQWSGSFFIKTSDLELICATPNSALACVVFLETTSAFSMARTSFSWWICSNTLQGLRNDNYFIKNDEYSLSLNYKIVEPAKESTSKQNTYVELMRQSKAKCAVPGELSSGRMVDKDCFYFDKLCP